MVEFVIDKIVLVDTAWDTEVAIAVVALWAIASVVVAFVSYRIARRVARRVGTARTQRNRNH